MQKRVSLHKSLIDVDDSVLIVVDVQNSFLMRLPVDERHLLVNRIAWLVSVAAKLDVPLVVVAENIALEGSVVPPIAERLPPETHVFNKIIFGLAKDNKIMAAVKDTGRRTAILVGLETDVCIAHSAIGLLQQAYRVVVVADATASPGTGHEVGLERVRGAGILLSSVKSLYFEWLRTADQSDEFMEKYAGEIGLPEGITL